jgi:1,4-dihydroxy-2-naphthoate octaprenyltransferase
MEEPQAVATRYAQRRALWKAAIKWPMYSVAVMPVLLAAGWQLGFQGILRWDQLFGFLLAAILLLLWENLSNDLFDADTGVDAVGKPHSVVNLTGRRDRIAWLSSAALLFGLSLMAWLAWRSHPAVLLLVLLCCGLGYVYQGPPFRLGYQGLGEPLCWLAFGPLATSAALLVLAPAGSGEVPWQAALVLARPWPPPWCCFAPTSIRWRKTRPMASAHRWFAWEPLGLRRWFLGSWVSPSLWSGGRWRLDLGRPQPCLALWHCRLAGP